MKMLIALLLIPLSGCVEWGMPGTIVYDRGTCEKLVIVYQDSWFESFVVEHRSGKTSLISAGNVTTHRDDCVDWSKP